MPAKTAHQSTDQQIAAALTDEFRTPAEIARQIFPNWATGARGWEAINMARNVLEGLRTMAKAVCQIDPVTHEAKYARWVNPHAAGVASLQEFYRREQEAHIKSDAEKAAREKSDDQVYSAASNIPKNIPTTKPESAEPDAAELLTTDRTPDPGETEMVATKEKPAPKAKGKKPTCIPVEFGGVSIGDKTCRIGIRINRASLDLSTADTLLTDRRLTGRVVKCPPQDDPAQTKLKGMSDVDLEISGVFDVKGFRVGADLLTCGLTFGVKEVSLDDLGHFAKATGRVEIDLVQQLERAEAAEEDEDDE